MIVKPIIPVWLMILICISLIIIIIFKYLIKKKAENKNQDRKIKKNLSNFNKFNFIIEFFIIILLFILNLRIMIPNGEVISTNLNVNVLFVIDTTVSMKALDYNNNRERFEGVINDCCKIVDNLNGSKFSIITFGGTCKRVIPFTTDSNDVKSELKALYVEKDTYAQGTSINSSKEILETTLKNEQAKKNSNSKYVVFYISDGEITKDNEKIESFSNIKKYVVNGAVMGYGTEAGGKMLESSMLDYRYNGEPYYIKYYDDNNNLVDAISKIDEKNLKKIAKDIGIEYINMNNSNNLNTKLNEIKKLAEENKLGEKRAVDIYYYFAIPILFLVIINFILKKKRII